MRSIIASTLLLFSIFCSAQDVYPLHPAVGDTIDSNEKLDYSLLPKSANKGFNFATIQYINSGFVLIENRTRKQPNGLMRRFNDSTHLPQEQIIEEQQKIQKINAFYKYLAEESTKPKKEEYKAIEKKIPIRFDTPVSKIILKEARMKTRIIEDQRRMKEFQMGLRPREMMIEIR